MTSDEITTYLKEVQAHIDESIPPADIDSVQGKLVQLSAYLGLSAELIRFSKQNLLIRQRSVLSSLDMKAYTPSIAKQFVESELWLESSLYDYANRINSALVHSIDALRTIVSLYGKELETTHKTKTFQT